MGDLKLWKGREIAEMVENGYVGPTTFVEMAAYESLKESLELAKKQRDQFEYKLKQYIDLVD